jgi:hypothetical protein
MSTRPKTLFAVVRTSPELLLRPSKIADGLPISVEKRHAANITAMTEFDSDPTGAGAFN